MATIVRPQFYQAPEHAKIVVPGLALPTRVVNEPAPLWLPGVGGRVADMLDPPVNPLAMEPVRWVEHRCGEEVWSAQRQILESVRDHQKTAVRSAHSIGKSHIASRAIAWWLDTHPIHDTFVVSTAPSAPQVRGILWRYLKDLRQKAGLPGFITEGEIPEWKVDGRLVAWGRKPAGLKNEEAAKTAFQGIHAKYVLVVVDEAGGVPKWLFDAIQTLVTSPTNRVLAIGNPDDSQSEFARINGSDEWNVIKVSAFDAPAYTGEAVSQDLLDHLVSQEWVNTVLREWGEDNPLYISKVLAEFPEVADDVLITPAMLRKAFEMWEILPGDAPGWYAADVARLGKDKTVVVRNRGGRIERVAEWGRADTAKTTERFRNILEPHNGGVPMIIDIGGGYGAGPFDTLRQEGYPVNPFDGSLAPFSNDLPRQDMLRFLNRRAEQYWSLREELDNRGLGLDPEWMDLQAQLLSIKWDKTPAGRIFIEKKEEIIKRLGHSPDHADTVMMATVPQDDWHTMVEHDFVTQGRDRPPAQDDRDLERILKGKF